MLQDHVGGELQLDTMAFAWRLISKLLPRRVLVPGVTQLAREAGESVKGLRLLGSLAPLRRHVEATVAAVR